MVSSNNYDLRNYLILVAGALLLAGAGFAVFRHYLTLDLPQSAGTGLVLLAIAAGIASFFSPCSFPLLLTLVTRQALSDVEERISRRSAHYAIGLSLGVSLFLLLLGSSIAFGAGPLVRQVTFTSEAGRALRLSVGGLLLLFGLFQANVLPVRFEAIARLSRPLLRRQARLRSRHPVLAFSLFGFAYVLAGFG